MAESGELKIGDLSVSDILGMGGAGISYRASNKDGDQVFLKVLKWEYLRKNDELEQEYALHRLSELSHPGLAKIFDIGYTTAGKLWYTRELFDDESKNLASFKPTILEMDEIGAGLLILQILDALDFLHRNGFIHGNLKESNIKLVKGNTDTNFLWNSSKKSKSPFTVKLTDFCLLEPFNESNSDILLPTFKTESDDLRSLGKILYKTYIDDDSNGDYSVIKIRDKVPEPLQVLISRLLGISRESAFNSCAEAISAISHISPQRASELSEDKLQKNIRLSKDIERQNYLLDILSDTEQSNGKFIILEGEDGSGKTVLVREFVKTAMSAKKQVSIFTCSNHHRPAEGLVRLLDDFLHILRDKNPAIVNHYEQVFARVKGERIPESGLLLDNQTELFEGLIKLLKELSELNPFCLIMEDIELASDYLLNFISMLLADLNDSKILLVATIAPSRIRSPQQSLFDSICSYDSVNRVQIQQLDYKNTIEHMRNLLTAPELPEDICARFYESTGGNILKLDELVKTAIAKGVLVIGNDSYHFDIRKFSDISEDIEINQIVGRLISGLHSSERALCQFISMFGGKAQLDAIETFAKKSDLMSFSSRRDLANIVWNLIAKGVLRRRFEAGGYHLFISHKLFADGIISSIPIEERKRIYDNIVTALAGSEGEMYFPERDIRISLLALKGSSPENAMRWAVRAQAMCERQYALDEKVFFLTKLIQMIPEEEIEYANSCQIKLAFTHFRRKEFGLAGKKIARVKAENPIDDAIVSIVASKTEGFDSWMYLEKAIKSINQLQDVQLRKMLINTYLGKLQIIDPRKASEFAKNFALSSDNSFDKIACFLTLSRISAAIADFEIAVEYADKALSQTSGLEFTSERIFVSIWKIKLAQMMGDQTTASRLIRRMSGLLSGNWNLNLKSEYYRIASRFYMDADDSVTAIKYLSELVSVESKLQEKKPLARALLEYGIALEHRGNDEKSKKILERARRIAEDVEDNYTLAKSLIMMGNHYLESELFDQALVSLERANRLLGSIDDIEASAQVAESLGKISITKDKIDKAKEYATALSSLADTSGSEILHAKSMILNGMIAAKIEKWDKAEDNYTSALRIFEKKKLKRLANTIKIDLAQLFINQEDYFRALSKLSEAGMFFGDDGGVKELKRIQKAELTIDRELGKYGEDYRNLRMLLEISRALVEVENLDELLPMIVDMALRVTGAERGYIMLLTKSGSLDFRYGRNKNKENLNPDEFAFSSSVTDSVLSQKRLISITDTESDEKFKARDSIVGLSLRSIMAAPLKSGENVIGLIYVDSQVPTFYFSKKNGEFFEALCSHASTAITYAELKSKNGQFDSLLEENKALKDLKKIQKAYIKRNMDILQDSVISLDKKINSLSSSIEGNGELKKRFDSITSDIHELVNIIDQFEKEVQNYS